MEAAYMSSGGMEEGFHGGEKRVAMANKRTMKFSNLVSKFLALKPKKHGHRYAQSTESKGSS